MKVRMNGLVDIIEAKLDFDSDPPTVQLTTYPGAYRYQGKEYRGQFYCSFPLTPEQREGFIKLLEDSVLFSCDSKNFDMAKVEEDKS